MMTEKIESLPTSEHMAEALRELVVWSIESDVSQWKLAKLVGVSQASIHQIHKEFKKTGKVTDVKASTFFGMVRAYGIIQRRNRIQALKAERTRDHD